MSDIEGPYIVWMNYGCEGWRPKSYPSLQEAVLAQRFFADTVAITRPVRFEVIEMTENLKEALREAGYEA